MFQAIATATLTLTLTLPSPPPASEVFRNYSESLLLSQRVVRVPEFLVGCPFHLLVDLFYRHAGLLALGVVKSSYARQLSKVLINPALDKLNEDDCVLVIARKPT